MKNDLKHISPWRGLASYEDPNIAKHDYKFCGRDTESLEVAKLVDNNLFVTVYGRTGVGKTSLLNAGVFPILRNIDYYPIYVRLSYGAENGDYAKTIIKAIEKSGLFIESLFKYNDTTNDNKESKQITILWQYFCTHKFKINETTTEYVFPVIVLDQFEEIFFQKREQAKILLQQIYYLLSDNLIVPEGWSTETNYRFVASIREDNLYLLEDVIDELALPVFKENRYRLRAMSSENAKEAILTPGVSCLKKGEETEIAKKIIQNATEKDGSISSLILSLLCNLIWKRAEQKNKENPVITKEDVPGDKESTDKILTDFYLSHTTKKQRAVIEQHYLTEDGHRKSSSVEIPNVNKLTASDCRIIREVGAEKEKSFELTHDRIAKVAYRQKRRKDDNKARILTSVLLIGILSFLTYLTFKFAWSSTVHHNNHALYEPKTDIVSHIKKIENSNISTPIEEEDIKVIEIGDSVDSIYCKNWKRDLKILISPNHQYLGLDTIWTDDGLCTYLHYKNRPDSVLYSQKQLSNKTVRLPKGVDSLICNENYNDYICKCYRTNQENLYYGIDKIVIDSTNKEVLDIGLFKDDNKLKRVELVGIDTIPYEAFFQCSNLVKINLEDVKEIGRRAFSACESLKEIKFSEDTVHFGENAFEKCTSLKTAILPKKMDLDAGCLFAGCLNLSSVRMPGEIDFPWLLFRTETSLGMFLLCDSLESITFLSKEHYEYKDSILYYYDSINHSTGHQRPIDFSNCTIDSDTTLIINRDTIYINRGGVYSIKNGFHLYHLRKTAIKTQHRGYTEYRIQKDPATYIKVEKNSTKINVEPSNSQMTQMFIMMDGQFKLNEIHIPYGTIDIEFPVNAIRNGQITLYVPYGCKRKYISKYPDLFLDIKEDSLWKRVKDTCVYMWAGIAFSFNRYSWFYPLVALGLFGLGWIFYRIKKRQLANNGESSTRKAIWAAIIGVPIAIICFMPPYWMIFEYIMNNVDSPKYNTYGMILGAAGGVISAYICSYLFIFAGKGKIWKSVIKMRLAGD